jgi:cyclophilin family peptidyl-prolyl cis-trans isomerase
LESAQLADIYRHLVLHLGEVALEPEVIIPSLAAWTDTTIINSKERRIEADTLIAKYMLSYMTPQHRDELVAAVSDVIWLGDTSPELSKMLSKAVNFAAKSSDKELLDSLQRAYTVLHLPWPGTKLAPIQSNIDWKTLESLPNSLLINFTNEQVIMDLLPYYAPVTTLKMVQLARIQYFANQAFHRVVPNFVVQTGDPTGSGWGGPGYMMRTEIAPIAYDEAGLVGMASSGLNTEGSQWFVTECPTPHLSTRYTIWGRMRTGMDKIYRIQLGEKIETIMPYTTK